VFSSRSAAAEGVVVTGWRRDVCDNRAMTVGAGDPRRARTSPTEADRVRAADTIRRHGEDGLLSRREVEERIEATFRATTLADLDAVVGGLPPAPHIAAEMVLSHGLPIAPPRKERPWWQGIVVWTLLVDVVWVVVWVVTGGAAVWLVVAVVLPMMTFTVRFVRRHRQQLTGHPARRGRPI